MMNCQHYAGVFPALYACYDDSGAVSPARTRALARYLAGKGVQGLYVGGSSGECIYLSVSERMQTLESVMEAVGGALPVIAHVACNNTQDSCALAAHAQSLGVDAIAAIPPIYFHLPPYAVAQYWNDISQAAPDTDFLLYNIPQLAGTSLTLPLLRTMRRNPRVIGVKNSSLPVQDIQLWRDEGGPDFVVMNGPDEQFLAGLAMGATGGIGGTYGVMPELFVQIFRCFQAGRMGRAREIQNTICHIIYAMSAARGDLYAVVKEILRRRGVEIGSVRRPLPALEPEDEPVVTACAGAIDAALAAYGGEDA